MSDAPPPTDGTNGTEDNRRLPTVNHPLGGRKRPLWVPLLWLLGFLVVLFGIYIFGVTVLVPAG